MCVQRHNNKKVELTDKIYHNEGLFAINIDYNNLFIKMTVIESDNECDLLFVNEKLFELYYLHKKQN